MEVSGRKPRKQDSATQVSSEEPHICAGCLEETGKAVEADGFCVTCNEFLCAHCYTIHTSARPMKGHTLLDKHDMPDKPFPPVKKCSKHSENLLDYFCSSHNQLACGVCVRTAHRRCDKVDYILDICDQAEATTDLERARKELAKLENTAEINSTEISYNADSVNQLKTAVISEYKEFQRELGGFLVKRGELLKKDIQRFTSQDKAKLHQIAAQNDSLKSEIKQITTELSVNEKFDRKLNLFTSMKNATSKITFLTDKLKQIEDNNIIPKYGFVRDPNLQSILEQPNTYLGKITCVNDNDTNDRTFGSEANVRVAEMIPKKDVREYNLKESNKRSRSYESTPEIVHDAESSIEKQKTVEANSEAGDESSNRHVTETMLHKPLHYAGKKTNDDQSTDVDTLRYETNASTVGIDQDHTATKSSTPGVNANSKASNKKEQTHQPAGKRTIKFERTLSARRAFYYFEWKHHIRGMTMLPSKRLVITESENKVIKLLDTSTGTVICHVSVEHFPTDVTAVSNDRLAVSLYCDSGFGLIRFMRVSGDRLSTERCVRITVACISIACHGDRLYALSGPVISSQGIGHEVQLLDLRGRVLSKLFALYCMDEQSLHEFPHCITVCSDGNIYISDWGKRTVTCFDSKGQIQWRYQDTDMTCPAGMAVDKRGIVYVACMASHNIHVVSPAGNKLQVWKDDRIQAPNILTFNEDENRLFVGMCTGDIILVYKVKSSDDPRWPCPLM